MAEVASAQRPRRHSGDGAPLSREAERIRALEAQVNHLRRQNSQLKLQAAFGHRLSSSSSLDDSAMSTCSAAELLDDAELIQLDDEIQESQDEWLFICPSSARSSQAASRSASPPPSGTNSAGPSRPSTPRSHPTSRSHTPTQTGTKSPGRDSARLELDRLRNRLVNAFERAEATPINHRLGSSSDRSKNKGIPSARLHARSHTVPGSASSSNSGLPSPSRGGARLEPASTSKVPRLPRRPSNGATAIPTGASRATVSPKQQHSPPAPEESRSPLKAPRRNGTPAAVVVEVVSEPVEAPADASPSSAVVRHVKPVAADSLAVEADDPLQQDSWEDYCY